MEARGGLGGGGVLMDSAIERGYRVQVMGGSYGGLRRGRLEL